MMTWLAVNKDGTELVTPGKPVRGWGGQWDFLEEISIEGEQGYMYGNSTSGRFCLQTHRQRTNMG